MAIAKAMHMQTAIAKAMERKTATVIPIVTAMEKEIPIAINN